MTVLSCPRCHVALESRREDFETRSVAHVCHRCLGGWVDGEHVGVAYPGLRRHGQRITELLDSGARDGTATCPRCDVAMLEFPFFDLWLDLCDRCHGLWIDGDETAFVGRAREEHGLPDQRGPRGYREAGSPSERVTCHECGKDVHPRRTLLTAEGAICDTCVELGKMSEALREDAGPRWVARQPGRLLRWLGSVLDADGRRLTRNNPK